ncbi:unnamed protein product [Moneuplotes crassus]|uniref:Uncharacterized protein n=1 Tax=Euplotes crassus TaxID=5936 RepID=A0AAD1UK44_EUPCR|nr:unnamed protein product [Moneuplotes crassus]
MESVPGCQAKDCSNVATYFNKDFMVYICDEHCQPSQRENCVKLGGKTEIEEVEEALEVLKMCTKNFLVAVKSSNYQDMKEYNIAAEKIHEKIIEVSKEFENTKENQEFKNHADIKLKIKSLYCELEEDATFNQFCRESYFSMMCDFLKANKSSISKLFEGNLIKQDENSKYENDFATEELQLLKKEFKDFKNKVINYLNPKTIKGLRCCYELITDKKNEIVKKEELDLNVNDSKDQELMKLMENNICSNLKTLYINKINNSIHIAKEFIFSSFPLKTARFDFNSSGAVIDSDQIIDVFCYVSSKVTTTFFIYGCGIDKIQLKTIFRVVAHNKINFGFSNCKIKLDVVPNLKSCLIGSTIQALSLSRCRVPHYCD